MLNQLFIIRQAEVAELGLANSAKLPVGEIIAQHRTAQDQSAEKIAASIGIWESSPGQFKRHIANREFSHIVKGWCVFTPEGGEPIELHAGDAVLFPANCEGVWDIKENFRKTYCIF